MVCGLIKVSVKAGSSVKFRLSLVKVGSKVGSYVWLKIKNIGNKVRKFWLK